MVGIRKHALKLENSPVGSHKSLPKKSNLHETKKNAETMIFNKILTIFTKFSKNSIKGTKP